MERIEQPPSSRLAALDSLRGIAILAVLLSHLSGTLGLSQFVASAAIDLGRGGVSLFFILSGYLIFRNVQVQSIPTFFCRRFFKVMPSYWLNIGIILLADLTLPDGQHFSARSYLACVVALSDVLNVEAVSGVFWTLLIEIKFYLFIAVQYALLKHRHNHLVLLALIALEVAAWSIRGRGSLTLAYFPIFYLGIEISLAEADGWRRPALLRLGLVALLLAGSLYLCLDSQKAGSALYLLAGAGLFVLFLRYRLSNRVAGFFGVTSYSNYLYHSLVAGGVIAWLGLAPGPAAIGALALALVATTAAGAVLYRLVEVPMVELGRRLTQRS